MRLVLFISAQCMAQPSLADPFKKIRRAIETKQTDTLTKLLKHPKSSVRQRAAAGLQACPKAEVSERSAAPLLACLENSNERDYVRAACGQTLSVIGEKRAVAGLIGAIGSAKGDARFLLVQALAVYRTPEAKATLEELKGDVDPFVSSAATGNAQ